MDLDFDELKATKKDKIQEKIDELIEQRDHTDNMTERAMISYAIVVLKEVMQSEEL